MRAMRWLAVALPLLASATGAKAFPQPSFALERCSWDATHIVVVSEEDKIDGEMEVLESWKGDLKKGHKLSLPDLSEFAPERERMVSKSTFGRDDKKHLPALVTGSRMVLFLIRKQEKTEEGKPAKTIWLPADGLGGLKVSTAWVEASDVFAVRQESCASSQRLLSLDLGERELKKQVDAIAKVQTSLTEALRKGDEDKVVATTLNLIRSDSTNLSLVVLWGLEAAGAKALPALRAVLKDDELVRHRWAAIYALTQVAGKDAGPDMVKVLERELVFWKKAGPDLPLGWRNGTSSELAWDEVDLDIRYLVAKAAVNYLGELKHTDGRKVVSEFAEYWKSLPQLAEDKQFTELCDKTLKALTRK